MLLGFNAVLTPVDIGWSQLAVSPYLALPAMIGARYGTLAGLAAGLVGALTTLIPEFRSSWTLTELHLPQRVDVILGFMLLGVVCGELQRVGRLREIQLKAQNEDLQSRVRRLDNDILLLRETKLELERLLITHDAELSTLDADLRRLFDADAEELNRRLLLLLQQQIRITDAAVYRCPPEGGPLRRAALLGSDENLPVGLSRGSVELVDLALQRHTPVSVPEFWDRSSGEDHRHLLAMPLIDSQDHAIGIVLVASMPFMSLNRKSVRLIALSCRWAARVMEIRSDPIGSSRAVAGRENLRIFQVAAFRRHVELADSSCRLHDLPSSMAIFRLADPSRAADLRTQLESRVVQQVRTGDFAGELGLSEPHVAVLLPLTGERGASIFTERVLDYCNQVPDLKGQVTSKLVTFAAHQPFEDLWHNLTT